MRKRWAARVAQFGCSAESMRQLLVYLSVMLLAGCSTYIQAPEAVGRIVDAETGMPIRDARVTRPAVRRSWSVPQGLPELTAATDRFGRFHIPVERELEFLYSLSTTPATFTPTFTVVADGYVTTNITVTVSSNTHWRVDLRRVGLTRR